MFPCSTHCHHTPPSTDHVVETAAIMLLRRRHAWSWYTWAGASAKNLNEAFGQQDTRKNKRKDLTRTRNDPTRNTQGFQRKPDRPARTTQFLRKCTLTQDKRTRQFTVTHDRGRSRLAHPTVLLHRPVQSILPLCPPSRPLSACQQNYHSAAPTARTAATDVHGALHDHHDNATHPRNHRHPMRPRASRNSLGPAWSGKASASNAGKLCGCVLPPKNVKALCWCVCVFFKTLARLLLGFPCDEETVVGVLAGFFLGSAAQNGSVETKNPSFPVERSVQ